MSIGGQEPPSQLPFFGPTQFSDQLPAPAIIILDRTACVISWDAAAELLFGYPAHSAVGKPFYHFLELESLMPGSVEWELQTAYYRGTSICNPQCKHRDGSPFRATAEIVPLWDGDFLGYRLTFSSANTHTHTHTNYVPTNERS